MLWISLLDTLSRFSQNCFRRPSILTTISLAWMGHWLGTDLILPLISLLKGKLTLDQRMDEHEKWRSKYFLWVLSVPILWLLWVLRLSLKIRKDEKTIFWSSQREFNTYSYFFQHLEKPAQAWKKKIWHWICWCCLLSYLRAPKIYFSGWLKSVGSVLNVMSTTVVWLLLETP